MASLSHNSSFGRHVLLDFGHILSSTLGLASYDLTPLTLMVSGNQSVFAQRSEWVVVGVAAVSLLILVMGLWQVHVISPFCVIEGICRGWCGTLKRVVWYFEEGDVVL